VASWFKLGTVRCHLILHKKITQISRFFGYFYYIENARYQRQDGLYILCVVILKHTSIEREYSNGIQGQKISDYIHALFWRFHQRGMSDETLSSGARISANSIPPPKVK
jgi:hypothetical protein